jgi:hypothetical protein
MNKYLATIIMALLLFIMALATAMAGGTYYFEVDEFIELRDAPEEQSYDGQAGQGFIVNSTEDGLEFASSSRILSRVNEAGGLSAGDVVYISGATGDKPQVSLADNTIHTKAHVFGMVTADAVHNEAVIIAVTGEVVNVDTSGFAEGDRLHLTTGGGYQAAIPTSGAHIHVGFVTKVNANSGIIELTLDQYVHDIRATSGINVELATGSDDNTTKISFEDYSGNELAKIDGAGRVTISDDATTPPLNVTERSSAPATPSANDIYLDDGTNTASGNPGWRRYTGSAWEDISAAVGAASAHDPGDIVIKDYQARHAINWIVTKGTEIVWCVDCS